MNRQETFEKVYAEAHGMPLESFHKYRMGDTYRLPLIAKCWRFWNLALDAVDIKLTNALHLNIAGEYIEAYEVSDIARACKAAGLRIAE